MSAADDAFVRYKSRQVVQWTLRNVRELYNAPSAMDYGRPLEGRTAFVIGAGYSLDPGAIPHGATIITVNAADAILRAHGITPDVLVIRESLDHADTVAASEAPVVCADLGVHPNTWDAAGNRLAWFFPGYPHTIQTCHRIAVRPSFGGSAALTTAVNLAMHWGAARIVLAGVDLAWTRVGDRYLSYHPEAPRGDLWATLEEAPDGLYLRQEGNVADDARTVRSGQKPQPKRIRVEHVAPVDWGPPLLSMDTLIDQRRWLETRATRHGACVEMINASRGAGIAGWRCGGMPTPLDTERPRFVPCTPIDRATNTAIVQDLDAGATHIAELCDEMLRPTGPRLSALPGKLHAWTPLIEALAAWRLVDGPTEPLERLRHTYAAMRDAAYEAREILNTGKVAA
jgi:uncharacterized Rossmann fold enzyme